jgi:hypothetical protein
MIGNNGLVNRYMKAIDSEIQGKMQALGFKKS